ncbi:reverse transcriptase domain-containing protein [Tanacetum coccineum]
MVDSQPREEETQGVKIRDGGTETHGLAYADSDKEAPAKSLARGFSDRFSLESFGTSDTHKQTRSTSKSQRTPSKNKEPTHLRRSRRLEDQSITKEKTRRERSKSIGKRSEHQETCSDSEREEGLEDAYEDLNSTYKRHKPTPFTQRITRFKYHRRAKLPRNIRVCGAAQNYFDDMDPKSVDSFEELSQKFFEEISQQKRYAKDPIEIQGIKRRQNEGLQAFMDRFKSKSSYIKRFPPVLRITAFMHGHGHPELAKKLNDKIPKTVDKMFERVRAFIRGEVAAGSAELVRPSQGDKGYIRSAWTGGPEKARNRSGPKEARRNMGLYTPYPRKDTFTPLIKTLKEILAMESVSFLELPPLIEIHENQNLNKFCDYHGDRGHNTYDCYQLKKKIEEVVASGKLAHLVKDIRQNNLWSGNQGRNNVKVINMIREGGNRKRPFEEERSDLTDELTFPAIPQNQLMDEPIILEGIIEGNQVRRILVDGGSSLEIMYEHCFRGHNVNIRLRLRSCRASMLGFSRETYHPLGVINLSSNYGKGSKKQNGANGVCDNKMSFAIQRHNRKDRNEKPQSGRIREQGILRTKSSSGRGPNSGPVLLGKTRGRENTEEIITISHERPNQYVTIGDCKQLLAGVLRENREVIAWNRSERTAVPRFVMGHRLKTCPLAEPVAHKRRTMTPDGRLVLKEKGVSMVKGRDDQKGEQVQETTDANKGETFNLIKKLQTKSTPTLRAWRLYLGKEIIEEGLGVGIILVSPNEKMHSHAIRLKFNTSNHAIDYEALLAGLAASISKGMEDLHVFMDSPKLVAQTEGNHTPATEQQRKYKKEIM